MTSDYDEGERRKADVLAALAEQREVDIRRGRRVMLKKMLGGDGRATADDVCAAVELPVGIDPRCLGSVPGRLAYDRIIAPAGFVRSARPERHASYIQVWELVDREVAGKWLADHPDLSGPAVADRGNGEQQKLFDTRPDYE